MDSGLGPMTDGLINGLLEQVNNPKLRDMFYQKLLSPVQQQIKKYQLIAISAYFVIVVLLIVIIYLILRKNG